MAYRNTISPPRSYGNLPEGVKWLLVANVTLFLLYFFSTVLGYGGLWVPFALSPEDVLGRFSVWQVVTYMFLHDPLGVFHILFNMLGLWWFGADLRDVGRDEFLKYYFLCGSERDCAWSRGLVPVLIAAGGITNRRVGGLSVVACWVSFPPSEDLLYSCFRSRRSIRMFFGAIAFLMSFVPVRV
jgi:membrane associated rhomboid family serine protease